MNIHERQVYSSSKIEFRPIGVIDPTDAEAIVEMRKEIARLRISQYRSKQSEYGESEILNRMDGERRMTLLKKCPFCGSDPVRSDCIGCGYIQISCPECLANITVTLKCGDSIREEEDELIKRWNRRTE